ncbi:MAG: TIGR01777 family protein [Phycisphaerae bacterium]|nr:TIGR01777 family protein [Gemmatimonadaceae bacterium]
MSPAKFRRALRTPVSVENLFAWHERPGAFLRLSPPWDHATVVEHTGGIRDGARVVLSVPAGPIQTRWVIEHRDYQFNKQFRDILLQGPFARFEHTHSFYADSATTSSLEDVIEYELPMGAVGALAGGWYADSTLDQVFRYRHAVLLADLERHAQFAQRARMKIAVTGASGFIGSQLCAFLTTGGHTVLRIGRGAVKPGVVDVAWDPEHAVLNPADLEGVDAVIHLAGANIAERWTDTHKKAIRDSRLQGTTLIAKTIASLARKPAVLLSASAIGIYGDRGDEVLDETSALGTGFLADVGREWEASTAVAEMAGIRVVHMRTGIVQGAAGGALGKQLPFFRAGVGGPLAGGKNWVSPIALDDEIGAMHFCLMQENVRGAVNFVAPHPITNAEYTEALGSVLHRPAMLPVPAFGLYALFGKEMVDSTVLTSLRVRPMVLEREGFQFRHPTIRQILEFELGRAPS